MGGQRQPIKLMKNPEENTLAEEEDGQTFIENNDL